MSAPENDILFTSHHIFHPHIFFPPKQQQKRTFRANQWTSCIFSHRRNVCVSVKLPKKYQAHPASAKSMPTTQGNISDSRRMRLCHFHSSWSFPYSLYSPLSSSSLTPSESILLGSENKESITFIANLNYKHNEKVKGVFRFGFSKTLLNSFEWIKKKR